ncbi:Rtn c-di-GMP phosphodiesterase class I (EAL domain) [Rhabdaerophilaceae bacterium]
MIRGAGAVRVPMGFQSLLVTVSAAALAAGLSFVAARYDLLVVAVAALAAGMVFCALALLKRSRVIVDELELLRDHLETTRQQAALLARHTRELRESISQSQSMNSASNPDISTLSEIVRDVADSLAELDRRTEAVEGEIILVRRESLARQMAPWSASAPAAAYAPPPPPPPRPANAPAAAETRPALREVAAVDVLAPSEPPRAVRQLVAAAIAADRLDLFLQRIVTLPQRKTRAYEVSLRPDGCDPRIATRDIRAAVEQVGHQLAFDRKLMVQTVRLARMFEQRQRDVLLIADLSQRYLLSEAAFDELRALVADAPDVPRRIIVSLPQRFFKKAVAVENESLLILSDMGFRFMMRDVDDLSLDLPRLQQSGIRWIRMDAGRLIAASQGNEIKMDVAAADFAAMLGRRQISLLIDEVEDEASVAELIDFNIAYAQGSVFSPPQPVRADALDTTLNAAAPAPVMAQPERRGLRELVRRA